VEIGHQQLTVDFVNESQLGAGVACSRADFAEELGNMNRRYQAVAGDVSERLKQLDTLHSQWTDYEAHVGNLTRWLSQQNTWLDSVDQLQGYAAIQQTIHECNVCTYFSVLK